MKKLLFLLFLPMPLLAQPARDSLKEVEVKSRRNVSITEQLLKQNTGRVQTFDSTQLALYRSQNVAELVSEQSPVFIKSYGYNSLSTLSFRGASAAQSLVLWNGVPVNNPALGVADLSLLPVFFSDQIAIAYGGGSALLGNGNVGGALLLDNEAPNFSRKKEAGAYLSVGSFAQRTTGVHFSGPAGNNKKLHFSVKALGQTAENDFSYLDEAAQQQYLNNARQHSGQIFISLAQKLYKGTFSLKAWGQFGEREIPPALFESLSLKQQTDKALRVVADWQRPYNNLKLAYLTEGMDYSDDAIGLQSSAVTHRFFLSDTWQKRWQAHELMLIAPLQFDWLQGSQEYQSQIALAALYQYRFKGWEVNVQGRAGWYDERFALTPGLGISCQITPWLSAYLSAQRSFRQPTLNELYYQPGGNPTLKPEEGWSGEGGYKISHQKENFRVAHEGALFLRRMYNWIIWYGGSVWTPHNIAEVLSRGAETSFSAHWQSGTFKTSLSVQTAYVLSTTVQSDNPLDGSIGRQLPYVPRYNFRAGGRIFWKDWLLSVHYNYTGYRFATSDESQFLTPFDLSGVLLAYTFQVKKQQFRVQAGCQNLWEEKYQVIAFRPMPGRVWQLGLRWLFL